MRDAGNIPESAPSRGIVPPHVVLRDFLDAATAGDLLSYAATNTAAFAPTKLRGQVVAPKFRVSLGTRAMGRFRPIFRDKIAALLPSLTKGLGMAEIQPISIETQLVAHGDGAFFKRHIDTRVHFEDGNRLRVLSGVYYFYSEPRAFSGGALRLYAIGGDGERHVDIEPLHNSLLVFPSWAPHEVMPVSCPSGRFEDSRFAVNCWVHREKATTPA